MEIAFTGKSIRTRLAVLFLLAAIIMPLPVRAGEEDGDVPPRYWSTDPSFYWVAKTGPKEAGLAFLLDGKTPGAGKVVFHAYKGYAHVRFRLKYAESVTLAVTRDGKKLFEAEVFYAPSYESISVPEEFSPYFFHRNEQEKPCATCHRMTVAEKDKAPPTPAASICYPCHQADITQMVSTHKPVAAWNCLICHQATGKETDLNPGAPAKYTIDQVDAVGPLCFSCHRKMKQKISSSAYLHGPVGENACLVCHDPHAANHEKLLRQETTELCVQCHEMEDILTMANVHPVITKKGCTACHDPHGSNYPLQLFNNIVPLCYKCHPEIRKKKGRHPVTGHPVQGPRDPRDKDKKFSCVSCHNPHASEGFKLLPEKEMMMVCVHCHKY